MPAIGGQFPGDGVAARQFVSDPSEAAKMKSRPEGAAFQASGAVDGARTRDPRRDRPVL